MFNEDLKKKVFGFVVTSACALASFSPALAQAPVEQAKLFEGINAPTYVWMPQNTDKPKAIILGLHGGCLHARSYQSLATELSSQGILFASLDLRGFGKWKFNHFGSKRDETFHYKDSIKDIDAMLVRLHQAYPDTPVIALGESLGANVAFVVASQKPKLVDGIVAVSPFSNLRAFLSPRMLVNGVQIALNPKCKLNLAPYLRTRLSNNHEEIVAQDADPLNRNRQSIGELGTSLRINMKGKKSAMHLPATTPLLVIVGDQDNLAGYKGTVKAFPHLPSINKKLVMLKGSGHLIVERQHPEARTLNVVSNWVESVGNGRLANERSGDGELASNKNVSSKTLVNAVTLQ